MESISIDFLLKKLKASSNSIHYQCSQVIESLQEQLEKSYKVTAQQKQLIQYLQQAKEYYQRQYKNNDFTGQFQKLKQENHRLTLIANTHRKVGDELKEELERVKQELEKVSEKLREKEIVMGEQEEKYLTVMLEKEVLEREWSKVVRAVKKKINKIMQQEAVNPQSKGKVSHHKDVHNFIVFNEKPESKQISGVLADKYSGLMKKATQMINYIDKQIAVEELEALFEGGSTDKKRKKEASQHKEGRRFREPLGELDRNLLRRSLNFDF